MTACATPDKAPSQAPASLTGEAGPAGTAEREADVRLRISGIEEESIVDGPGLRMTVFTQGCPHNCPGCHNPHTHSLEGGELRSVDELVALYAANPLLEGITLSGGEPFLQAEALCPLAEKVHALGGTVVTYTGFTFEALLARMEQGQAPGTGRLLELTDILVDGPYVEALRDLDLPFWGSSNQRPLDHAQRRALAAQYKAAHTA